MRTKNISIAFIMLFICIMAVSGCGRRAHDGSRKEGAIPVKVMKVRLENLNVALEYVGSIKGIDEAIVYPKTSGKIVEKIKEDSSPIAKDEAIAYIDRDEVGLKFEKAPVESPLAGIVGRVYVDIGSSVSPQTPIALVANMDKAQIDLEIPEKYLPKVSVGQEANISVDAYPAEIFTGRVVRVSPVCDLATRSAPIEINVDNEDHRLQSGMFAKVELILEKKNRIPVVLKEAIIGKPPDAYIYIIEDGKAVLKNVSVGLRQGPYYEVTNGIKEGDLVVIMGQQRLRDGSPVMIEE